MGRIPELVAFRPRWGLVRTDEQRLRMRSDDCVALEVLASRSKGTSRCMLPRGSGNTIFRKEYTGNPVRLRPQDRVYRRKPNSGVGRATRFGRAHAVDRLVGRLPWLRTGKPQAAFASRSMAARFTVCSQGRGRAIA